MTAAAEYHRIITQAQRDYEFAKYIDSTARMVQEQDEARRSMRNAWITSAGPLPGIRYEGSVERWRTSHAVSAKEGRSDG